jgi:NADPH:quinone reductase
MKALTYTTAHSLDEFSIQLSELPAPQLLDQDVLIKIKAIGFNPVDYKIRASRGSTDGKPLILGWDASGTIEKLGRDVHGFNVGDEVFYAGDVTRQGSYAEYQAVDSRLIAKKPRTLSFSEAAAIPLTAITAYEALILQSTTKYSDATSVLIVGGAGGVGSMGIQLLKALTPAKVIATASREESVDWCKALGADFVIDHSKNLKTQLKTLGIDQVDFVFSTTHTDKYYEILPEIIKPFGHVALIDDPETFDLKPFKTKSIYANFEFMFTKSMFGYEMESQGALLAHVAALIDQGKIKTTLNKEFVGLTAQNIKEAHSILEKHTSVGKMVLTI